MLLSDSSAMTIDRPATNSSSPLETLAQTLADEAAPLAQRFRALFALRSLNSAEAVSAIAAVFVDPSVLLKHELAYVLGQMRRPDAIPHLHSVLADNSQDPMVRHEAAEAIGAIAHPDGLPILEQFISDPSVPVKETVQLAIARIHFELNKAAESNQPSPYASVDPAPPSENYKNTPINVLEETLVDPSRPLFERYRAMFALRNNGSKEAVLALAYALDSDASSALFRHEIAYVFGQLQHPDSVPALIRALENDSEAPMVRHEAAEALGSIASPDCLPALRKYAADPVRVVRESCIVGLDLYDYETSSDFQHPALAS